jgi:ERCC4-type nuclease
VPIITVSKVLIFVNTKEASSGILDYFWQYECDVQKKMLLYGDFVASDRVIIAKKTVPEFVRSICEKKLFQQLGAMKDNFERPVLIIEGRDSPYGGLQPDIIRGTLATIAVDMEIPIIWTRDMADTAGVVYCIARREQFEENRQVLMISKKAPETLKEKQEYLVSSLPDVSKVRAKAFLKHFKTPKKLFSASVKELQEVKGVGKKTAENIKKVIEG